MKLNISLRWCNRAPWRLISIDLLSEIQGVEPCKPEGLVFIDLMVLKLNFEVYIEKE